jgi:phage antirepressor YoqD-like protein
LVENEIQIRVQEELQNLLTSDPIQAIMLAAKAIQQVQDEKRQIVATLKPKADMWDIAMASDTLHEMSAVAKILNFRNMGRNKIFQYLKAKDILRYNNEPYQRYVDGGYFKVVEQSFDIGDGVGINRKPMVTQKGLEYIGKLLLEDGYAINER